MRRCPVRAEAVGMAASAKSFLSDAGYGEQELDANSALMEVDKAKEDVALRTSIPRKLLLQVDVADSRRKLSNLGY